MLLSIIVPVYREEKNTPEFSAVGFKIINKIADVSIPPHTGDFCLRSRRAVTEIVRRKEFHGFLRDIVAVVAFKECLIRFDRPTPRDRPRFGVEYTEGFDR